MFARATKGDVTPAGEKFGEILRQLSLTRTGADYPGDLASTQPRSKMWPTIAQEVRQQFFCNPPCFLRRIPPRVLQRVREDGDETGIVRRLPAEVGGVSPRRAGREIVRAARRGPPWTQPSPAPSAGTSVRAHRPTALDPRSELGSSDTMLHASLSAK
jgi:hypothetical protein